MTIMRACDPWTVQVYEILDNAIDEIQGGHATNVRVELDLDSGWVSISDDGRGIPTSTHPAPGKSALETVLTVLHAGGKFGGPGQRLQRLGRAARRGHLRRQCALRAAACHRLVRAHSRLPCSCM